MKEFTADDIGWMIFFGMWAVILSCFLIKFTVVATRHWRKRRRRVEKQEAKCRTFYATVSSKGKLGYSSDPHPRLDVGWISVGKMNQDVDDLLGEWDDEFVNQNRERLETHSGPIRPVPAPSGVAVSSGREANTHRRTVVGDDNGADYRVRGYSTYHALGEDGRDGVRPLLGLWDSAPDYRTYSHTNSQERPSVYSRRTGMAGGVHSEDCDCFACYVARTPGP